MWIFNFLQSIYSSCLSWLWTWRNDWIEKYIQILTSLKIQLLTVLNFTQIIFCLRRFPVVWSTLAARHILRFLQWVWPPFASAHQTNKAASPLKHVQCHLPNAANLQRKNKSPKCSREKKQNTGLAMFSDMRELLNKLWIICKKKKKRFKMTVEFNGTEEKRDVCNYHRIHSNVFKKHRNQRCARFRSCINEVGCTWRALQSMEASRPLAAALRSLLLRSGSRPSLCQFSISPVPGSHFN